MYVQIIEQTATRDNKRMQEMQDSHRDRDGKKEEEEDEEEEKGRRRGREEFRDQLESPT